MIIETTGGTMKPTDNFEAFEMAFALWYWCSHWHGGLRCPKYAAMCVLQTQYKLSNIPSIDFDDETDDEYFLARMYYQGLTADNWNQVFSDFEDYMNTEWDKEAC
jgi:hypothetical protein